MKYEIAIIAGHGTEVVAEAADVNDACEEVGRLLRLDGVFGVIVRDTSSHHKVPVVTLPRPDRRHGDPFIPQAMHHRLLRDIAHHPDPRD